MKRIHPFFTIPGLVITAMFLVGMGLVVWQTGGLAFSPGQLSAKGQTGELLGGFESHTDFEKQCSRCHTPLVTTQDELCLQCHTKVIQEIESGVGTHSLVEPVERCYSCHTEHKGRGYDILQPGLELFEHERTGFSLLGHQFDYSTQPIRCSACHRTDEEFTLELNRCSACHAEHDPSFMIQHAADFGRKCLDCHNGTDDLANFDHSSTDFPLIGKHNLLTCVDCHRQGRQDTSGEIAANFNELPLACNACHTEPKAHHSLFNLECQECHTPDGWRTAKWQGAPFEHYASTGFSLAYHASDRNGNPLTCTACHASGIDVDTRPACIECHRQTKEGISFVGQHQEQFGSDCLGCHDGADRMHDFDHARVFPLDGAHQSLKCETCHVDRQFSGTPRECVLCHAEPEIHAGFFGVQCQDCHSTQAWSPAQLRKHDFPLDHGEQGLVSCQTCHPGSYIEYTCYGCHAHSPAKILEKHLEEGISSVELSNCTSCHPAGLEDGGGND